MDINLYPWREEYRLYKQRRFWVVFSIIPLLTLFLMIGVHFIWTHKIHEMEDKCMNMERREKPYEEQERMNNKMNQENQYKGLEYQTFMEIVKQRHEILTLITNLGVWLPRDVYLTEFIWQGNQMEIKGVSKSERVLIQLIYLLRRHSGLENLEISKIQLKNGGEYWFTIQGSLNAIH